MPSVLPSFNNAFQQNFGVRKKNAPYAHALTGNVTNFADIYADKKRKVAEAKRVQAQASAQEYMQARDEARKLFEEKDRELKTYKERYDAYKEGSGREREVIDSSLRSTQDELTKAKDYQTFIENEFRKREQDRDNQQERELEKRLALADEKHNIDTEEKRKKFLDEIQKIYQQKQEADIEKERIQKLNEELTGTLEQTKNASSQEKEAALKRAQEVERQIENREKLLVQKESEISKLQNQFEIQSQSVRSLGDKLDRKKQKNLALKTEALSKNYETNEEFANALEDLHREYQPIADTNAGRERLWNSKYLPALREIQEKTYGKTPSGNWDNIRALEKAYKTYPEQSDFLKRNPQKFVEKVFGKDSKITSEFNNKFKGQNYPEITQAGKLWDEKYLPALRATGDFPDWSNFLDIEGQSREKSEYSDVWNDPILFLEKNKGKDVSGKFKNELMKRSVPEGFNLEELYNEKYLPAIRKYAGEGNYSNNWYSFSALDEALKGVPQRSLLRDDPVGLVRKQFNQPIADKFGKDFDLMYSPEAQMMAQKNWDENLPILNKNDPQGYTPNWENFKALEKEFRGHNDYPLLFSDPEALVRRYRTKDAADQFRKNESLQKQAYNGSLAPSVQSKISDLGKTFSDISRGYTSLQDQYSNFGTKYSNLQSKNSSLRSQYSNLTKQASDLSNQNSQLQDQYSSMSGKYSQAEKEKQASAKTAQTWQTVQSKTARDRDAWQKAHTDKSTILSKAQEDYERLLRSHEEVERARAASSERHKEEKTHLEGQFQPLYKAYEEAHQNLNDLFNSHETLNDRHYGYIFDVEKTGKKVYGQPIYRPAGYKNPTKLKKTYTYSGGNYSKN